MEIGAMTPQEWPWVLNRSVATGWAQLLPAAQAETSPQAVAQVITQQLHQLLTSPGGQVLVARANGAPIAYLIVTVTPDDLTQVPCGLFYDIWVEPEWRGKAVSTQLTAAGEDHCRRLGLRLVRRWVAAHNQRSIRHTLADGSQVERIGFVKQL